IDSGTGGHRAPRKAATPAGYVKSGQTHDCDNVRSCNVRRNKTRSLSLMSALRVNSGTCGGKQGRTRPAEGKMRAALGKPAASHPAAISNRSLTAGERLPPA